MDRWRRTDRTLFFASINVARWRSALRLAIPSEHDGKKRGLFGRLSRFRRQGDSKNGRNRKLFWFPRNSLVPILATRNLLRNTGTQEPCEEYSSRIFNYRNYDFFLI